MSDSGNKHWYALYTRARTEKKLSKLLEDAGYEVYLPLRKTLKQWSDRKKWVEEPLLPSYVFLRILERESVEVLSLSGAVRFVWFSGKIASIPDDQVQSLKILTSVNAEVGLTTEHLQSGCPVEVISGPLKGLRAEVVDCQHKKRVFIRIAQLGLSLRVEVAPDMLRVLPH